MGYLSHVIPQLGDEHMSHVQHQFEHGNVPPRALTSADGRSATRGDTQKRGDALPPDRVRGDTPVHGNVLSSTIGSLVFAILCGATGMIVGCMHRGDAVDGTTRGPFWDPAGSVPFREYVYEVNAWLNVTSPRMTPQAQAAAMQRGLGGLARTLAMRVPPRYYQLWGTDQRRPHGPGHLQ